MKVLCFQCFLSGTGHAFWEGVRRAKTESVDGKSRKKAMRPLQLELESDANHRALRRCYRCGSYARPYGEVNGAILCEPCAKKDERRRRQVEELGEGEMPDPTEVSFVV